VGRYHGKAPKNVPTIAHERSFMNAEDNQIESTTEVEMPESLFGDEETVDEKPTETETETTNTEKEETKDDKPTEEQIEKFTLKYNGEIKEVTKEEAITLAQKGMNYDKLNEKFNALQNSRPILTIKKLSEQAGMTEEEYLDNVDKNLETNSINKIAGELQKQYPNTEREVLVELAKTQYALDKQKAEYEWENKEREKAELEAQLRDDTDKMAAEAVEQFVKEYPDVDLNKALDDPELVGLIEKGKDLLSAYITLENKRLKAQLDAESKNKSNRAKTTGSMKGDSSKKEVDAFLSGFLD